MTEKELEIKDRELVRGELVWISKYLRKKYDVKTEWIQKQLYEMIPVSV
jgi:hypothetical protein